MKIDRLETHDRYQHFTKQNFDISECVQDIINQRPFGDHAFYIFAHARTLGMDEKLNLFMSGKYKTFEEVPEKTIIWQPRLTKPKAQTNSMLFKVKPGTDEVTIIWILPPEEMWAQYCDGLICDNKIVSKSIYQFRNELQKLEAKEEDDLDDNEIDLIYKQIAMHAKPYKPLREENDVSTIG